MRSFPSEKDNHSPGERTMSAAYVLEGVASTCKELASASTQLQEHFGSLVATGRIIPCHQSTIAFQDLDRIAQVLDDLSELQLELSVHVRGSFVPFTSLAASMRLESLVSRILDDHEMRGGEDEFWS